MMRHPTADELAPMWAALRRYFDVKRAADKQIRAAHLTISQVQADCEDQLAALKAACGVPPACSFDDTRGLWLDSQGTPMEF